MKTFPLRCVTHHDCESNVALGVACLKQVLPARESAVGLLVAPHPVLANGGSWHRPCEACEREGAVPEDLSDCCGMRWVPDRWRCRECGERAIPGDLAQHVVFGGGVPVGEYNRWHRVVRPPSHTIHRAGYCGPLEPEDDYPGHWAHSGQRRL